MYIYGASSGAVDDRFPIVMKYLFYKYVLYLSSADPMLEKVVHKKQVQSYFFFPLLSISAKYFANRRCGLVKSKLNQEANSICQFTVLI